MLQDIRYALRVLGHAPLLTAVLVISLGIGVGANAAVFNLISALLLRPPAGIGDAGSLVVVKRLSQDGEGGLASGNDVQALRVSGAFEAVAAYDDSTLTGATIDGVTRRVRAAAVTDSLFDTLQMPAARGRMLTRGDTGVVVISHKLWEVFGRGDDILNTHVTLDGETLPIVGVAPPRFRGLHPGRTTDVWRLLSSPAADPVSQDLSVLARTSDASRANELLAGRFSVARYSFIDPSASGGTRLLSAVLVGSTLLVLICASVNAVSLLLSRGNARRRDLAVKLALGASRTNLTRQLLLESAIIGLAGGLAGLVFALWTTTIVPALFAPEHAEMLDARLTPGIVIITIAGSMALGIGLGLLPALRGTAPVTPLDLRGDAGSVAQTGKDARLQRVLVVTQIALSTLLVLSTVLLNRSLGRALDGSIGHTADNVLIATLSEPPYVFDPVGGRSRLAQVLEGVQRSPTVRQAGFVALLPFEQPTSSAFRVEEPSGPGARVETATNVVSLTYFETAQTALMEGRFFTASDSGGARPVAIINDVAMRRFFGASAVGRRLIDARGDAIEIVGVVGSGRYRAMQESPGPMLFRPLAQDYRQRMHLAMRLSAAPSAETYRRLRPALGVGTLQPSRVATLDEHLSQALVMDRFVTALVSACGLMALVLAIVGAYSLMSDSVQRRTREIGLRLALGSSAAAIARSIVGFGVGLAGAGIVAGLCVMMIIERVARTAVSGLPSIDAAAMFITAGALLLIVTVAALLPMRRAVRVNPTVALRHT